MSEAKRDRALTAKDGAASQDAMLKVSVIPPLFRGFENNALFESRRDDNSSHSVNIHWFDYLAEVYKRGHESNIVFGTADVLPKEDADVLIYMRHPAVPKDVVAEKSRYPRRKLILMTLETSLGARYTLNPKNHVAYDGIFTYVSNLIDDKRYFFLPPRAYYRHRITTGLPFQQRRIACLVGTNRQFHYRSGLLAMKKGWKFSFKDWIDYVFCPGELMSFRSKVGMACARCEKDGFDIYGEGWDLAAETDPVCLGVPKECTLAYIGKYRYYFAFENHSSSCGLISERVWDALWGDAVPIYLGHTGLNEFIPRECYIDARQFKNASDMLKYLDDISESTWEGYHQAGREFIHGRAVEPFLPETFADSFIGRICAIAKR